MKKTIGLIITLVMMLITLAGCVNIDYQVTINSDGSGDIRYIYGFNKDTLETLGLTADEMVESMKEEATESDYDVEKYEDDEIAGFVASKHVDNVTTGISLEDAFGEEYVKETEGSNIKIEKIEEKKNWYKTKYSQDAQIDLTSMEEMESSVTMKYIINLPVKVSDSNASEVSGDGKTLTWNLVAGEINEIKFEAITTAKYEISIEQYIILTSIEIVIIVLIIIILLRTKSKKVEKKEPIKEKAEKKESKKNIKKVEKKIEQKNEEKTEQNDKNNETKEDK